MPFKNGYFVGSNDDESARSSVPLDCVVSLRDNESRQSYLCRVAAAYIREYCPDGVAEFDEAVCDGYCLADDLESAAD